jgi:hypothetical protein
MSKTKITNTITNQTGKLTPKTVELTSQQVKDIIAKTQKKRFPAPAPQPMKISERLKLYNSVLSKIDPLKNIRIIPNPTITLTPAAPRSPDGKGSILLVTADDSESCYWDTDPSLSETGTIQMPNYLEGYVYLTFQTVAGNNYALELQLTMGSIPTQAFTGTWQIFGPSCLMQYVAATPAQTIITGFKATDVKSSVMLSYTPNYDPKTIFGGARFLGCTLTQL